jgi:hypothetical protein
MKIHSQEEIEEMFRRLGLATDADRQKFRFAIPGEEEELIQKEQLFIRIKAETIPEGEEKCQAGMTFCRS